MHHCLVDVTVVAEPTRSGGVQDSHSLGFLQLQLAARRRREQVVEAEPPAFLVERDQEQVGSLELVKERR